MSVVNNPALVSSPQPLSTVPAGTMVRVVKITGGARMLHTLAQSSILRGTELAVMRNDWGPLLLAVDNKRMALDRDLAYHVQVCALDPMNQAAG